MISSLVWVKQGHAEPTPRTADLDDAEFARIQKHMQTQLKIKDSDMATPPPEDDLYDLAHYDDDAKEGKSVARRMRQLQALSSSAHGRMETAGALVFGRLALHAPAHCAFG